MKKNNIAGTILIIDDYPESLAFLSKILGDRGYKVRAAKSGKLGLKSAKTTPPDLILLDVMMPVIDGYEVCRQLKADETTARIPILFLSALNEVTDKVKGFELGAVDFITKPFQAEEVLMRVKTHLELSRLQRITETVNSDLKKANEQLGDEIALNLETNRKLENEHTLLTALINSPEDLIVFSLDREYRYTAFNENHRLEMQKVWGVEITLGMNLLDCLSIPEIRALAKQSIDRAMNGESFHEVQYQPGADIFYEFDWNPVSKGSESIGAVVFIRNISKQKKTEKELSRLRQMDWAALRVAKMGHWQFDFKTGEFIFNDQYYAMHGITAERVGGYRMSAADFAKDWVHPEEAALIEKVLAQAFESNDPNFQYKTDARIRHTDGSIRWVNVWFRVEKDEQGSTIELHGVNQDITERKNAEEAIRVSENLYRKMIQNSPMGMHFYQLTESNELVFTGANPSADLLLGIDNSQFIGKTIEEAFPPLASTEVPQRYREAAADGMQWETEQIKYQDDKITGVFEVRAFQTLPNHMVAMFHNITQRVQHAREIQESADRFRNIFEHAAVGKSMTTTDGKIYTNEAFQQILGYTADELADMHWKGITHPEHYESDQAHIDALLSGEKKSDRWEKRYIRKDGTVVWVDISSVLQRDAQGKPMYFITTIFDITEQKKLQREITQTNEVLSLFIQNAPIYAYIKEVSQTESRVIAASDNFIDMIGIPASMMKGKTMQELFPAEFAEKISADDWEVVSSGKLVQLDEDLNGRHYTTFKYPIRLADKTLLAGYSVDITERIKTQEALRESSARLDAFMDFLPALILIKDSELRPIYANKTFRKYFPADAWMHKKPHELFPQAIADQMVTKDREALEQGSTMYEENWINKYGVHQDFLTQKFKIEIPGKEPLLGAIISDITEQKKAEAALHQSEEIFEHFMLNSPVYVFFKDEQIRSLRLSKNYEQLLGKPLSELLGKDMYELFPSEFARKMVADDIRVLNEGKMVSIDEEFGGRQYTTIKFPIYSEGKPKYLAGYSIDVTDERAIQHTRQVFSSVLEQSLNEIYIFDMSSLKFQIVNRGALDNLGYTMAELSELTPLDLKPEFSEEQFKAMIQPLISGEKEILHFETVHKRKNGSLYPVDVHLSFNRGEKLFIAVISDFTAHKLAEETLRESELRFRMLFDKAPLGYQSLDIDGYFLDVNQAWLDTLGYERDEVIGKWFGDFLTPKYRDDFRDRFPLFKELGAIHSESEMVHKNGQLRYISFEERVGKTDSGEFKQSHSILKDITEQKQAEEKLQLQKQLTDIFLSFPDEQMYGELLKVVQRKLSSPYGMLGYLDEQGNLIIPTMDREVWDLCDIKDKRLKFLRSEWGDSTWCEAILRKTTVISNSPSFQMPPGHIPILRNLAHPVIFRNEVIGLLLFANKAANYDETDRVLVQEIADYIAPVFSARIQRDRNEEALHQLNIDLEKRVTQRTSQLQEINKELEAFSYSVSHDLRAPLRGIDGFVKVLSEDYAPHLDAEANRILGVIRHNAQKMSKLIDDLLTFSRISRRQIEREWIDMRQLAISVFYELTTPVQRERITFRSSDLPQASGDSSLVRQLWNNLLSNAVKFSAPRSSAVIEVGYKIEKGEVIYSVADNGVGFNMKYYDKMFGVFQRLHSDKEFVGTGVGLALVQRIVVRHGGKVWAESTIDAGATFYFTLEKSPVGDETVK